MEWLHKNYFTLDYGFCFGHFFFLKEKIGINFSLKAELGGIALDFVLPVGRK
jgi:hypothetical protein